jgi:hypothetical protein
MIQQFPDKRKVVLCFLIPVATVQFMKNVKLESGKDLTDARFEVCMRKATKEIKSDIKCLHKKKEWDVSY